MIKTWNKFLDMLYGDYADDICMIIGQASSTPSQLHGKIILFVGKAGTGKSSLLEILADMFYVYSPWGSEIEIIHDADPNKIKPISNKIIFAASNKMPTEDSENVIVFRTTGKRFPTDEYRLIMEILHYMAYHVRHDCQLRHNEEYIIHQIKTGGVVSYTTECTES